MNKHSKSIKQKQQKKKKKQKQRKQHKRNKELAILPDIPEGVVCEILSRLPVKSLVRFKCVCKQWQSIIQKDQFFIDLHFSRMKKAHRVSLVDTLNPSCNTYDLKCTAMISTELVLPSERVAPPVGVVSQWKHPFLYWEKCLFCTTNGLICAMGYDKPRARIYNISTRESTPWIESTLMKHACFSLNRFGLGYDPVTKEHKVVAFWKKIATDELVCEVLTVRRNSWKRIDVVFPPLSRNCNYKGIAESVNLNGFICWMDYHIHFCSHPCVIQFDVGSEKFRKINILLPNPIFKSNFRYHPSLIDMDGRLAVMGVGKTSAKMYIFYEEEKESSTASSSRCCNYYWVEEIFSEPHDYIV